MSTQEAVRPPTVTVSMAAGDVQIHSGEGELLWSGQYVELDDTGERVEGYMYRGNPNVNAVNPLTDFIINKFKVRNAKVYLSLHDHTKASMGQVWVKEFFGLTGPIKLVEPLEHYRRQS